MGLNNFGVQKNAFYYKQPLQSEGVGLLNYKTKKPGIYSGFQISRLSDTSINISTGNFVIEDTTAEVSLASETTTAISSFTVSSVNYMVILRLVWVNSTGNYVDCMAVQPASVLPSDVVICKLLYTAGTLTGVDYSYRTYGNLTEERTLLDPVSNVLWINPSTNFWYINGYTIKYINETIKSNQVVATVGSWYLTYNGTTYTAVADSTAITYSTTKNGWYDVSTGSYRILAHYSYNGSSITLIDVYDKYPTYISIDSTLGLASSSDLKVPTEKAISNLLETRGYTDNLTTKNLSTNVNWDNLITTGFYNVSGSGQVNAPDTTTTNEWMVTVNTKGGSSLIISQTAVRKDTNQTFFRIKNITWNNWKSVIIRTSTLVVAASNSHDKYSADYVCDGTDDDVEIQTAINALASGGTYGLGGTVTLLEGTYNITTNILIKSNVNLQGQGTGTILKRMSSLLTQVIYIDNAIVDFSLGFFLIDGNKSSYSPTDSHGIYCVNNTSNTNSSYIFIKNSNHSGSVSSYCFYNCINLSNCEAINSGDGYYFCLSLNNCSAINLITSWAFRECHFINNCIVNNISIGVGTSRGFYRCYQVSTCKVDTSTGGSNGMGFDTCNHLINCYATNCLSYGFYNCTNCQQNTGSSNGVALQLTCYAGSGTTDAWANAAAGGYNS